MLVGNARIIITLHQGSGKTEELKLIIISDLDLYPTYRIIVATYNEDFATLLVRDIRNIILENQDKLSIRLAQDSKRVD